MPNQPNQRAPERDRLHAPAANFHSKGEARVFIDEGFVWDEQNAYLFDIDGTLLRSRDRIHYGAFSHAVQTVLGHPLELEGVVLHGNTDPGILREAFRRADLEEQVWLESSGAIAAEMTEHVLSRRAELDLWVMPGVEATLAYLKTKGTALGVATGNLESIGWLKIEVAGLRDWFTFGGFADAYERRADMIAHALRMAKMAAGEHASVCVVGDTPFDISAARANGLPTIAVATGHYSFDELMESKPEACASTLTALLDHAGVRSPARETAGVR
jgi:phosphoglycolate phosphatase-like HAD superfamily hydrolase